MSIYLTIAVSVILLILYIIVSFTKKDKFRIKREVLTVLPLRYHYTIEYQYPVFKNWTSKLKQEINGQMAISDHSELTFISLEDAQKSLDKHAEYNKHKVKYYQVDYIINKKDQ